MKARILLVMTFILASINSGFATVPYNLADFQIMNSGVMTSDEPDQFISMTEAYNHTYNVNFTVEQVYQMLIPYDELYIRECSISTKIIARTTGIHSNFGWYNPNDITETHQLCSRDGDYFGFYDGATQFSDPGDKPFGFYLDASLSQYPLYPGGFWYSESHLNNDVGNTDHLLTFAAPDVWLAGNPHLTSSYLFCWEDMFWQGGNYENNFSDGYKPNAYIADLNVRQSDRDFNDFIIQMNKIKPNTPPDIPVPEPSTIAMFGIVLIGFINIRLFKNSRK